MEMPLTRTWENVDSDALTFSYDKTDNLELS